MKMAIPSIQTEKQTLPVTIGDELSLVRLHEMNRFQVAIFKINKFRSKCFSLALCPSSTAHTPTRRKSPSSGDECESLIIYDYYINK